jgi:hypothetical protein
MHAFIKKWGMFFTVFALVGILLIIRLVIVYFQYDVIVLNTQLIAAFIGAVIFTMVIIFTGTLPDFIESEKIPSELAASIKSLYMDAEVLPLEDPVISQLQSHVRALLTTINTGFRQRGRLDMPAIAQSVRTINMDIHTLAKKNVAPPFCVKLRVELTTIDRICKRIHTIQETRFVPTAFALSQIAISALILVLLFVRIEPLTGGLILFALTALLLIGILYLIIDMDDPFTGYATVDLKLLWNLEHEILENQSSPGTVSEY